MSKLRFFFFLLIVYLATITFAIDSDVPPIAAYKPDGHLYIFGLEDEPIRVTNDSYILEGYPIFRDRNHLWSPDGTKLIFHRENVGIYDVITGDIWFLDAHTINSHLMNVSLDGEYLIYASHADGERDNIYPYDEGGTTYYPIVARRTHLEPDSEPELLGVIYYLSGGGGGSPCLADGIIADERGWFVYANIFPTILVETPYGLLSDWTVTLRDFENNTEQLFEGVDGYASEVSPSRTRLATISSSGFDIISLETFDTVHYGTIFNPDYGFVWSQDEQFIYYAVTEMGADQFDTLSEEAQGIFYGSNCDYRTHSVSIHQLNLGNGNITEFYNAPFYAIGSIMPDPQGDYLYFTAISNAIPEWVKRMIADDCENACVELFYPDLYRLNLENGEIELILGDVIKATLSFAWE